MRIRKCLLLAAAGLMLALTTARDARAQAFTSHFDENFPTSGIGFSDCTGEYIFFEGFLHVQGQTTLNKNGYHSEFHFQLYGRGVGLTSGKQYIYQDVFNDSYNYLSLPIVETQTESFHIIGQGSLDNLEAKVLFHITINADGTVTADNFRFSFECK
jgi:hypothetical protein